MHAPASDPLGSAPDLSDAGSVTAVVLGDAMLDVYERGTADRLSPEGPFPVVDLCTVDDHPGGAANVAAGVAALGARARLVSVVGTDEAGDRLLAAARVAGVDVAGVVRSPGRATLVKRRVVADGRTLLRVDGGSTGDVDDVAEDRLAARFAAAIGGADVVIVSDYRYGAVTDRMLHRLSRAAPPVVVDSKRLRRFAPVRPWAVTSNYEEVLAAVGRAGRSGRARVAHVGEIAEELVATTGAAVAAVTLDADGVVVVGADVAPVHLPATGPAVDPCGAGDAFTATMAVALATGRDFVGAALLGVRAAGVAASKPGTARCSREELSGGRPPFGSKVCGTVDELLARVAGQRRDGAQIVFTNGCFDVLHPGHVAALEAAARLGDVLVVGLNADESVRRLKGPGRPVHPLAERAAVVAALSAVDHVVPFGADTPFELLERLRPDVYCKGGDYAGRWTPEMELVATWGGRVETTPYLPGRSTTALLARGSA